MNALASNWRFGRFFVGVSVVVSAKAIVPQTSKLMTAEAAKRATTKALGRAALIARQRLIRTTTGWSAENKPQWRTTKPNDTSREVSTDSEIFLFQDGGTKAHPIRTRRRPYLHFFWGRMGRWTKTKEVNHPGNKARGWTKRIAKELEQRDMPIIFGKAFAEELK